MKLTKLIKKWRVIILFIFLLFSYLAISPSFAGDGVVIKSVDSNSSASFAGVSNPSINTPIIKREQILSLNNININTIQDYYTELSKINLNQTVNIKTDKREYIFLKDTQDVGITVDKKSKSNIRLGLELQGGTRVLLQPQDKITDIQREDLISVMSNRLNTYGLTDLKVKKADDLLGNKYIVVEIAGATKQDVKDLIASQGKFEAKIGNDTVFEGGKKDITFVCRNDGTCSGIRQCLATGQGYNCEFQFSISLSGEAAKRHATLTQDLEVNVSSSGSRYLSKTLDLFLDGLKVDSLQIGEELKGSQTTQIAISGPGYATTQEEAIQTATTQMNRLQTILITGSLPTKLDIVKIDSISPDLGAAFVKNALLIGLLAILAVALVLLVRYKNIKIAIPMIITSLSEIFIILGFSAFFKYNLDLAAIAGIIATVGTGVDDQIVIVDEIFSKEKEFSYKWKQKIKRAFFIIMAAWAVGVASMLPLLKAGAGLLTGFALVTIAGISIGVFITRPAFSAALENIFEE